MLQLQEPRKSHPFSLFNLAFRPFFLFGALFAFLLVGHWIGTYQGNWQPAYYQLGLFWHAHEMLFGFTLAIIGGFLMTAVRTWTQVQTPFGWTLAAITLLWLSARLLPFIPSAPGELIAVLDLAFTPAVALGIGIPILRSHNYRNLVFLIALSGFFIANLLVHLQLLGFSEDTLFTGLYLALYLTILVITVLGGRVIPFFTEKGIGNVSCQRYGWLEKILIPVTVFWLISQLFLPNSVALISNLVMAAIHGIRVCGWRQRTLIKHPLLWILHIGYGSLALGCLLMAAANAGWLNSSLAIHTFTLGAIGCLTLGMMARVSLGHTGRVLKVHWSLSIAFALMVIATLIRISVGLLPLSYHQHIVFSGVLWSLAWLIFVLRYTPILIKPRVDGLWG